MLFAVNVFWIILTTLFSVWRNSLSVFYSYYTFYSLNSLFAYKSALTCLKSTIFKCTLNSLIFQRLEFYGSSSIKQYSVPEKIFFLILLRSVGYNSYYPDSFEVALGWVLCIDQFRQDEKMSTRHNQSYKNLTVRGTLNRVHLLQHF